MKPHITVEGGSASYDGKKVLDNISLTIYDDDYLGIIGPNGGGKTTLVKVILGLKKPDRGNISFYRNILSSTASFQYLSTMLYSQD